VVLSDHGWDRGDWGAWERIEKCGGSFFFFFFDEKIPFQKRPIDFFSKRPILLEVLEGFDFRYEIFFFFKESND
jgi:hypothetical protein